MKTNCKYIHEYSLLDEMTEAVSKQLEFISLEMAKMAHEKRQMEMKAFFEGTAVDTYFESEGILTKIGNAVLNILTKISNTIRKITDKFFNRQKDNRTDVEKVNSIITQHPELKNKICKGIDEKWFTYKDVAAYEKDIVQLVNMVEKGAIDHKTFREKMSERLEKFNDGGKAILGAGATIVGLLTIIPRITKAYKKSKASSESLISFFKNKFKGQTDGKEDKQISESYDFYESTNSNPEVLNAISQEMSKALNAITAELNKISKSEDVAMNALRIEVMPSNKEKE